MAEAGVWVNPTMHDLRAWLWYFRDEEAAGRPLAATDVATHDELRRLYDDKLDAVRRLHAAGVRLIAGSDSAWGRSRAGGGWLEIDALTDAGLSTAEAIVGRDDRLGRRDRRGRCRRLPRAGPTGGSPRRRRATRSPTSPCSAIPLDVFQAGRRIVRSRAGAT